MTKFVNFLLAVGVIAIALVGCVPPPDNECIEFEDLAVGTTYLVGDLFSTKGVKIEVWDFTWSNNIVTNSGHALVDNSGMAGGSGNEINANNVNLYFDFGGLLTNLTLLYGAHGGNLNFEINGDFANVNNLSSLPPTLGGVKITATPIGTGGLGKLELSGGEIELFAIGGQELWVDHVCPTFK
jgi:hypothetical protein